MSRAPSVSPRVRSAQPGDVAGMVALSEAKRAAYEREQPVFWRRAADAAAKQRAFFQAALGRSEVLAFVADAGGALTGFVIGTLTKAPPVYDPGGLTLTIDDFVVGDPAGWDAVGVHLLRAARSAAAARGAVQVVVVCGDHDARKRALLDRSGLTPASTWLVGPV